MKSQTGSTRPTLQQLQNAARRIEQCGEVAFSAIADELGLNVAYAMLVMHVRRNLGACEFPPDPVLDDRVSNWLDEHGLQW